MLISFLSQLNYVLMADFGVVWIGRELALSVSVGMKS